MAGRVKYIIPKESRIELLKRFNAVCDTVSIEVGISRYDADKYCKTRFSEVSRDPDVNTINKGISRAQFIQIINGKRDTTSWNWVVVEKVISDLENTKCWSIEILK